MVAAKKILACFGAGLLVGWGTSNWVRWAHHQLLQWLWPLGPLKLERPLVTFDIEATGLNVSKDRILEIAAVKVWPDGKIEVKGPQRLNPKVHISAEVTAIHHITKEDLVGCPSFAEVAQQWRDFLDGCDLAGYNAKKFDVPMLRNEFRRAGHFNFPPLGVPVVDAFRIFSMQEPRTLSAAVSFYCGRPYSKEDAHSALGDAWATLKVLVEQVRRYGKLPHDVTRLAELCAQPNRAQDITPDSKFQWRGDQPIVAFGKHSGEPIAVLTARHRDHLMWMSGQDWGDESLILVAQALKGLLPTKDGGWQPLFDTPPTDTSAAAASTSSSTGKCKNSTQQQQQQDATQEQQQQAAQEPQQQATTSSADAPHAAAAAQQHRQQGTDSSSRAAAQPPPEFTGWPELPVEAAPAQTTDSWGAEPADGWSLLEPVNYDERNPGPQTPRAEPEAWDSGAEVDNWHQQQQQQQQQHGQGQGEEEGEGVWHEEEQQQPGQQQQQEEVQ